MSPVQKSLLRLRQIYLPGYLTSLPGYLSSVQFSPSVVSDSLRPHGLQHTRPPCPSPTPRVYSNLCPMVMPSNHFILCCPLLLPPSIFPSIRVFSNESALPIRWPKYWSFSFNIRPSNKYSGLISFRMDWLDFLAVQGTLKSLLQHHSWKASILRLSAVFTVQLSHPYMTTGKTIALTRQIFVGKVMSLLFNMLSRLVIAFLPSSKHLLISWLQSPSVVILEPPKIKSVTVSTVPLYLTDISKERYENGILHFPCTPVPFSEYPLPINDATISIIVQAYSPQIMNRYCHIYCIHLFS